MSLLMDALRKAEADKDDVSARQPAVSRGELQLEPLESPVPPPASAPLPTASIWPTLEPLEPLEPPEPPEPAPVAGAAAPLSSHAFGSVAQPLVVDADTHFVKTHAVGLQRWLVGLNGLLMALALGLSAVGVYVWQQVPVASMPPPPATAVLPPVVTPAPSDLRAPSATRPLDAPPPVSDAVSPAVGLPEMAPPPQIPPHPTPALSTAPTESGIHISKSPSAPAKDEETITRAYAAFLAGQLVRARTLYTQALSDTPDRLDAQLGLAAIALSAGALPEARRRYQAVLSRDPRNAAALAALFILDGGAGAPDAESRLRQLLAVDPEDPRSHFTLGSYYAQQRRWADAQTAFFAAARRAPDNADYAFNLAVSLDRLGQGEAALTWYRRAVVLRAHGGTFAPAVATTRVAQLSAGASATP